MSQAVGTNLLGKNNVNFHATSATAHHGIGFILNLANLEWGCLRLPVTTGPQFNNHQAKIFLNFNLSIFMELQINILTKLYL